MYKLSLPEIATRIKTAAKEKGITIKELQTRVGVNVNYINQMRNGKEPSISVIANIAEILDCPINYLLGVPESSYCMDLTSDEKELLMYFRKISNVQQQREIARLQLLAEQAEAERTDHNKDNAAM